MAMDGFLLGPDIDLDLAWTVCAVTSTLSGSCLIIPTLLSPLVRTTALATLTLVLEVATLFKMLSSLSIFLKGNERYYE